jgi:hypothetical protein
MKNIELVDILGNTLEKKEINSQEFEMDLNRLNNGIYFIKISTTQRIIVKKILIEN